MTTATSRYFALLALTAALWGAQPLLVKITMRELNPSTMTAVRYLLMSITFFALMRWRGLPLLPPRRNPRNHPRTRSNAPRAPTRWHYRPRSERPTHAPPT